MAWRAVEDEGAVECGRRGRVLVGFGGKGEGEGKVHDMNNII